MKSIVDNIYVKLAIFSSVYITVLIFFSPAIDHLFTSLEQDKAIKEENWQILIEIVLHVIVLVIAWYILHMFLKSFLEKGTYSNRNRFHICYRSYWITKEFT